MSISNPPTFEKIFSETGEGRHLLYNPKWLEWFLSLQRSVNSYLSGNGSPEGVVTAGVGTIYSRLDGGASTTLYVKESGTGATGWVPK
jgi:hypothetical protein